MYLDNFLDKATNDLIHINRQVSIVSHIVGRIVEQLIQAGRVRVDPCYNSIMAYDSAIWVNEFVDEYPDCLDWAFEDLETELRNFIELRIFESNYMDE